MSTKKKESVSSVKEKRGSSPSHSHSPLSFLKSTSKPKTSTSRSLDSSPSDKATPNYLKPTLSSSLSSGDTTKLQGRKAVPNTDNGLKSNLARRRSFDKPPSPTRSLKPRGVSPTPTSSGKAGRAGASPKSERILKGAKEGGKHVHHLYARAVGALKKSASKSKKGEASTAKEPKHDGDDDHTAEDASDHPESPIGGEEDPVVADQVDEDTLDDECHKADSPTLSEHPDADEVEMSPTVLEQHEAKAESPTIGEDEVVLKAESPMVASGQDDDDDDNDDDEKAESPTAGEQQEMEGNDTNDDDQSVAGTPIEEAEGEDGARLSHGKKDVGLSNNVIEEMTREQRRNKVRALAGAFETVISLQDHK